MADLGNQDFPTNIGPDASFKGELTFEKGLRLQGRFEGKISTPGRLHIAREAKMQADVEAGAIIVEGDVSVGPDAVKGGARAGGLAAGIPRPSIGAPQPQGQPVK